MKSRLRSGLEAALGLVVLGFAVVWLSGGCEERVPAGHARIEERGPAGSGRVVAALARTEASREWASGEVASARDTVVSSRVLARIEEILVRAGSRVSSPKRRGVW